MSFGREYTAAVEAKQVAQQEAQRAQFIVEKAKQERQEKIVRAEGEAEAARMISNSTLAHACTHTPLVPMYISYEDYQILCVTDIWPFP